LFNRSLPGLLIAEIAMLNCLPLIVVLPSPRRGGGLHYEGTAAAMRGMNLATRKLSIPKFQSPAFKTVFCGVEWG